ncbi:hypothetical protein KBX73_12865 [Acetobacter persici]|uniref:hypothetical protein n=1 Tax=Acetobacter persici TaxID=1076596 RepID=UPI0020CEBD5C|nr:hypothetical protein [Acetobacter persici]MCP9320646.1 hypothetical protein [Acetobacter persici]
MLFDDKSWLNDYAEYGPSARAALGILVAKGDWGWWHDRTQSALYDALHSAVRKNGIAVWGGDEAVFNAQDWIDTALAIDLAQAFREFSLSRAIDYDFRLRIERAVWSWGSVGDDINELRTYLSDAVPGRRVFFDWPQDRRPRTKKPDRQDGALVISTPADSANLEAGQAFADVLNSNPIGWGVDWRTGEATADVFVTKSIDTLTTGSVSAELVIIATDDQRALVLSLDKIRSSTGAKCVVRVQESDHERWLQAFAAHLAWDYSSIDTAAAQASDEIGVEGAVVVSNQTFLLRSRRFLYSKEDNSAGEFSESYELLPPVNLTEIGVLEKVKRPMKALPKLLSTTPPPTARVLGIDVIDGSGKKLGKLPLSGEFNIAVAVRPQTPLTSNLIRFPDQEVIWDGDKRVLQIHLLELRKDPVTKELVIPRTGASAPVSFQYLIHGSKPVDLRFMVCDGAQILQTARFRGHLGEIYTTEIETDFTPLEDKPRLFDMALLVNDSLGGKPSITTIAEDQVTINIFEGHEVETLRNEARDILFTIASRPNVPFDEALKDLADVGSRMLKALKTWVKNWPTSLTRVQLMTRVNAVFPFEFLYEGDLPDNIGAPICPQSKACLSAPRGTLGCCSRRPAGDVFCPMGFVGLNAVVERHAWDGDETHPFWLRRSQDFSKRDPLRSLDEIVFAASAIADNFSQDDTIPLNQRLARIVDVEQAFGAKTRVNNWHDWRTAVARESNSPSIAVLVPHVDGTKLFIGASDGQYLSKLSMGKAIVAIVVGCNTAEGEVAALSLPNMIMQGGEAKVVIAALTKVLGRYANTAAMILGTKIREASRSSDITTVGDFVTDLRRSFLAQDIALGLVLISIGDADVVLGGT